MNAFSNMIADIPVKACQYTYIRLVEKAGSNKAYQRVTTNISGGSSSGSVKRKEFIDAIENKYGMNFARYADTIRKASMLYRYLLKNTKNINISKCMILRLDKLNHFYETQEFDLNNKDHLSYIENCEQTFMILLTAFKMRMYTNLQYQEITNLNKK